MPTIDELRAAAREHARQLEANGADVFAADPSDPDWLALRNALRDANDAIKRIERIASRRADRHARIMSERLRAQADEAVQVVRECVIVESIELSPCMVYVVHRGDTGEVKIGISRNVAARVAQLQTASGAALKLLACFPGDRDAEAGLHARFARDRRTGEWFTFSPAIERWLAELPA